MNFLLITIGSHGDVHPFIGIGRTLQARGHSVTLITNGQFESLSQRAGIQKFVALGTGEEFERISKNPDLWHPKRGMKTILNHLSDSLEQIYDTLRANLSPGTTVVASSLALAAIVDSEVHGTPTVTVHLAPSIFMSSVDRPKLPGASLPGWLPVRVHRALLNFGIRFVADPLIAPKLNAFRATHGLPPTSRILQHYWHSPHLVIGLFPEWFAKPASDWPPQTALTDFPLYDESEIEPLSEPLQKFLANGSPPVAFTPGSAMRFGESFFRVAVDACELIHCRALLLTRHDEQLPKNLPPHALHVPYAPFSALLPRCHAIVHHGGIGTTAQALRAGVPQLIMPLSHDQPDNAQRLERLGVGASVLPRVFKPKRVARALKSLIESTSVEAKCKTVAEKFVGRDPLAGTCDLLERFASDDSVRKRIRSSE